MRCILRLLGVQGHVFFSSLLVPSAMRNMLGEPSNDPSKSEVEQELCSICLGILQFIYCDDKGVVVKKDNTVNLSLSIAELIKQEGHQIDSFSIEVSIPPIIRENEHIVR